MVTATQDRRTVNLGDAAKALGVSRSLLFEQAKKGTLPFPTIRIGSRWLVSRAVLDRVLSGDIDGRPDAAA